MQRKRGELVPIGEVVSGLDDELVAAIRDDSPQARRSFTVADQVNQLISASEADPDLGFMARMMALCSLPRLRNQMRRLFNAHVRLVYEDADRFPGCCGGAFRGDGDLPGLARMD